MTTTTALIVVDVQRDFCEGGALGVQGGNAVAKAIADHAAHSSYDLAIASLDWHDAPPNDNCGHFALEGEPDFVTSWPVHCVEGTDGSFLHPALEGLDLFDDIVRKGQGMQSYSAFEGVSNDAHSLLAILRTAGVTEIDVCGIATDHCVRATVFDALGLGFKVRVLLDMCAGVAPAPTNQAITDMMKRGAVIVRNGAQQ